MPFQSKLQARYLESKASPLSPTQKKEWEQATDFDALPERKSPQASAKHSDSGDGHWSGH